jgi:hypothetical protein
MRKSKAATVQPPKIDAEQLALAYAKARQSLVAFRYILLVNDLSSESEPASFHEDWSVAALHGDTHEAWEAFRESAKTQYLMRAFPLHCLTFPDDKRDYGVIIKNNATLARNKLHEIEREYHDNPALSARLIKIVEESGDVFEIVTLNDDGKKHTVRVEAYGKGASIRGLSIRDRRPKFILIDDPQDVEDSRSETVQAQDWEWFLSDVMFLAKSCRIFLIGNNLGERCILERAINAADELGLRAHRVPAIIDGQSAWPARYSLGEILAQRDSYDRMGQIDIWLRDKMCTATSEANRVFDESDYRWFPPFQADKLMRDCKLFATMDPARSTDKQSCYRAITVNAVSQEGYWFILEIRYGRWPPATHIDMIFNTVTRWGLRTFGIERGEYLDVIQPFIHEEMAKRQVFFDVVPIEHAKAGSKLERIKILAPRFRSHTIWFPTMPVHSDGDGNWVSEIKSELAGVTRSEIKSLYIDLVDSLAMQEQIAQAPYRPRNAANLPREALMDARLI